MFFRNSHFPSNQVLNYLKIDRIFTQNPPICEECGGSLNRVKGNGISKKLTPPILNKKISGGRKIARMNQLLLLIYYHTLLGSTWNAKENEKKPIIFIKLSAFIYFKMIQIEVFF